MSLTQRFSIGGDNRIAWVSDEWLEFAWDKQAPELTRRNVVGHSLFKFISGAETQYQYYLLLDAVRGRQVALGVPFRCDSPAVRRFMSLMLSPLPEEGVAFEGSLIREESRAAMSFLELSAPRTTEALKVCSFCKAARVGKEWLDLEVAAERLELFRAALLPQQDHGVCTSCARRIRRLIDTSVAR